MKIQKLVVVILLSSLLLIMVAGCSSSRVEKDKKPVIEVTEVELVGIGSSDYHFTNSNKSVDNILSLVRARAYSGDRPIKESEGLSKLIRWVSSDPTKISVAVEKKYTTSDEVRLRAGIAQDARGIYTIHAESLDGSLKSKPVTVIVDNPLEAIQKVDISYRGLDFYGYSKREESTLISSEAAKYDAEFFAMKIQSFANKELKTLDDVNDIIWVSSDPSVISVVTEIDSNNVAKGHIQLHKEGVVDIYAETKDGRVKSNSVRLTYGNFYQKESLAARFASNYVLNLLRYKTAASDYKMSDINAKSISMFNMAEYNVRMGYQNYADSSFVETREVVFEDDTVKILGIIDTFREDYNKVRFSFALKLKVRPGTDYGSYDVLESVYEFPELIITQVTLED